MCNRSVLQRIGVTAARLFSRRLKVPKYHPLCQVAVPPYSTRTCTQFPNLTFAQYRISAVNIRSPLHICFDAPESINHVRTTPSEIEYPSSSYLTCRSNLFKREMRMLVGCTGPIPINGKLSFRSATPYSSWSVGVSASCTRSGYYPLP